MKPTSRFYSRQPFPSLLAAAGRKFSIEGLLDHQACFTDPFRRHPPPTPPPTAPARTSAAPGPAGPVDASPSAPTDTVATPSAGPPARASRGAIASLMASVRAIATRRTAPATVSITPSAVLARGLPDDSSFGGGFSGGDDGVDDDPVGPTGSAPEIAVRGSRWSRRRALARLYGGLAAVLDSDEADEGAGRPMAGVLSRRMAATDSGVTTGDECEPRSSGRATEDADILRTAARLALLGEAAPALPAGQRPPDSERPDAGAAASTGITVGAAGPPASSLRSASAAQTPPHSPDATPPAATADNPPECCVVMARLAPQDYHRVHMPVDGTIIALHHCPGEYFSVNPLAVRQPQFDIFTENRRLIIQIASPLFGPVVMVLVGATFVGSCIACVHIGQTLRKGAEVGYFAYGGSSVIVLFRAGTVCFDSDLVHNTAALAETRVRMGERIGTWVPTQTQTGAEQSLSQTSCGAMQAHPTAPLPGTSGDCHEPSPGEPVSEGSLPTHPRASDVGEGSVPPAASLPSLHASSDEDYSTALACAPPTPQYNCTNSCSSAAPTLGQGSPPSVVTVATAPDTCPSAGIIQDV